MTATCSKVGRTWILALVTCAGASLAAVCAFTLVVGTIFWSLDGVQPTHFVSVLQSIPVGDEIDRVVATLYWTFDHAGTSGCRQHLAVHSLDSLADARLVVAADCNPHSITAGPARNQILVGTWEGEIQLIDFSGGEAGPQTIGRQTDGAVSALSLSEDRQVIVSQGPYALHAWRLGDGTRLWSRHDLGAYCHVQLPGSRTAIVATLDNHLFEIDLATGETLRTLAHYHSPVLGTALSPDGGKLAVLRSDSKLMMLDSRSGTQLWERQIRRNDRTAPGRMAAFSPCGTMLVTSGSLECTSLSVWNAETGQLVSELHGHEKVVQGASFVTSNELRSWAADGTVRVWNVGTGVVQQVNQILPPNA